MWNFVYFDETMASTVGNLGNFELGSKVFEFAFCKDQSGCFRRDAFKEHTNGDVEIIQEIIIVVA